MQEEKFAAERLAAYSDAVFAVIVTIMVLELKAPDKAAFSALTPLWPTAVSYAVSYFFIAIIWINHHHLWRFVGSPSLKLIWINFVHLFLVSLLPFATAWIARTRLASRPMIFYAGLFVAIDIAYNLLERPVLAAADPAHVSARMRRIARRRSLTVLAGFTAAMLVASVAPWAGFGLISAALILHVRPDLSKHRRSSRPDTSLKSWTQSDAKTPFPTDRETRGLFHPMTIFAPGRIQFLPDRRQCGSDPILEPVETRRSASAGAR